MVDIHSHIIPGIDDGSINMGMTLKMLSMAAENGTRKIVATPHYCKRFAETPYNEVKQNVIKLNDIVRSENINIEIYHGQEVYYTEDILSDYKSGLIGTINDSSYMLVELPMSGYSKNVFNVFYELQVLGVKIILAHPERYQFVISNPQEINSFLREGFYLQMNSGSLVGGFGKQVKKTCETLLESGVYSFIGSDSHNINERSTDLSEMKRIITKEFGKNVDVFSKNGNKVLLNQEVELSDNLIEKKKKRFIFF